MGSERACPAWAEEMIATLRSCEIFLGNIPRDAAWDSKYLKEVVQKSFPLESVPISEQLVDRLFKKIAAQLIEEGFSHLQIADFMNQRIRYQNSPPYCSAEEVKGSLQ